MAKVNPGELRNKVEVFSYDKTRQNGISTYEYKKISSLRCKVKRDKNKFFYGGDTRKQNLSLIFICPNRKFLIPDNFIKYNNDYYLITEVFPFDDLLYTQVFAEKVK